MILATYVSFLQTCIPCIHFSSGTPTATPTASREPRPSSASQAAAEKVKSQPKQPKKRSLVDTMLEIQRYSALLPVYKQAYLIDL